MMESPKFITCPECNERYNDTNKRRLIDTCGHPRCYSCLFKDNPCPVCSKLPRGREISRTLSNDKLLENINGETNAQPRHQRYPSDTVAFTGMFRKDSYLRTLYSYDPGSKDFSSDVFVSANDTPDQASLCSSVDELDEGSSKSATTHELQEKTEPTKTCPKAWPSCPELSLQENIWQMRPTIERRKRPSSLYQMKYSTSSPRSSAVYSPRSSGYWSELEQLSESESLTSPIPKYPTEAQGPPSSPSAVNPSTEDTKKTTATGNNSEFDSQKENSRDIHTPSERTRDPGMTGNKVPNSWQMTRVILQQWRFKPNRTRSTECLRLASDGEVTRIHRPYQSIHSMPVECHTKKVSENNVQKKAFMTDV